MAFPTFTDGIDVAVNDAILASHVDNLADNTEFDREVLEVQHSADISTATGFHLDTIPDLDSTYDLGETTTPKRWANLFVDSIGDTGQTLAVAGSVNFDSDTLFVDHANGRVGFQTSSPQEEVDLTLAAAAATVTLLVKNSDNTDLASHAEIEISSGGTAGGDPLLHFVIPGGNEFAVGIDNDDGDHFKIAGGGALGAGSDRLIIDTGGNRVAIGCAPASNYALRADANTTGAGYISIDNSNVGATEMGFLIQDSVVNKAALLWDKTDAILWADTGVDIRFKPGGSETVVFDSGGNVGIGTTSPDAVLEVEDGGTTNTVLTRITADDNSVWGIVVGNDTWESLNVASGLRFAMDSGFGIINVYDQNAAAAADLALQNTGGNVGIGTTSPANKLDVEGAVAIGASYSGFSTAPSNGLIVEGDVGIGTSSPGANLEVDNANYGIVVSDNSVAANKLYLSGNGSDVSVGKNLRTKAGEWSNAVTASASAGMVITSGGSIDFYTRAAGDAAGLGTCKLKILNTGNVGIGTTTPANKLDVEGAVAIGASYAGSSSAPSNGLIVEGNVGVGTTTFGASAAGVIGIGNGTAPTDSPADMVQLYAEDVSASSELKVRDEAGNVTVLSPHNFSLCGGPSEEMAWAFYSERDGRAVNVDMLRVVRLLEKLTGEKLVFEKKVA